MLIEIELSKNQKYPFKIYEWPLSWNCCFHFGARAEREARGQGDDDNVQLLQTPNLTGYRTPNDDIQTKREVENEA